MTGMGDHKVRCDYCHAIFPAKQFRGHNIICCALADLMAATIPDDLETLMERWRW